VVRGREGARAEQPVAQAVARPKIVGLALDRDFQLAFDQEQMVLQAMPWRVS
jgi:hypothetical protein